MTPDSDDAPLLTDDELKEALGNLGEVDRQLKTVATKRESVNENLDIVNEELEKLKKKRKR